MTKSKKSKQSTSKQKAKQYTRRAFLTSSLIGVTGLALEACNSSNQSPDSAVDSAMSQNEVATPTSTQETLTANKAVTEVPTEPSVTPSVTEPDKAIQEINEPPPEQTPTLEATSTQHLQLEPTPFCDDDDYEETISQTAGPFYTPNTPERNSFLEEGITGTTLVVTGRVLTTDCQPIAGAILDFWHASDVGEYDNVGYRLRGHQFSDEQGNYRLETILPGLYPGRTRHIHVKVQGPNTPLLITQTYFPDEPHNQTDSIFNSLLVMDMQQISDDHQSASFDFVLRSNS